MSTELKVGIAQPVPSGFKPYGYALAVLVGLDVLVNAILGGLPYQTVSCRIGESIAAGRWASRVPWPSWFRAHCAAAIYTTTV